ncbi:MAG TPA: ABC transporter ATP-binding protein [Polyangiaceae bacterium]|nr:ABC transporter ATP-binding protein [Polyangiaceae bacterium]
MNVVEVADLSVRYGSATALDGVSLSVAAGERVALVGSNGAGKSSLLNALSGVVAKAAGTAVVHGRFAHVPEGRQLFRELSVEDNLRLGAFRVRDRDTSWLYSLLPKLERLRKRRAGALSGGQQQLVAIARGLMARPDVLAIDEMSLGLAPLVVRELSRLLLRLNAERGLTVLLVEQSARVALGICTRAYVLESGRIVAHGTTAELARSAFVRSAYLGDSAEAAS